VLTLIPFFVFFGRRTFGRFFFPGLLVLLQSSRGPLCGRPGLRCCHSRGVPGGLSGGFVRSTGRFAPSTVFLLPPEVVTASRFCCVDFFLSLVYRRLHAGGLFRTASFYHCPMIRILVLHFFSPAGLYALNSRRDRKQKQDDDELGAEQQYVMTMWIKGAWRSITTSATSRRPQAR